MIILMLPYHILCDNLSATYVCANPVLHTSIRHLALEYHFVRDKLAVGSLCVSHVSTKDQLVDILTKPLSKQRFHLLWSKIGVSNGTTILQGYIKFNSPQS